MSTEETPSEKHRRERRAAALTALNHLLNVVMRHYTGDRPSEEDLLAASKVVSGCIAEFESEANAAEARLALTDEDVDLLTEIPGRAAGEPDDELISGSVYPLGWPRAAWTYTRTKP